jgi:transcriptional regulator with XRE-family HTH domain
MDNRKIASRRLRQIRNQKNLSLRALAELSGLSSNAISLIERGDNSPTVSSLHNLAQALGVPITAFFEQYSNEHTIHLKKNARPSTTSAGVRMENLGSGLPHQQVEPFLMRIEPGKSSTRDPVTHQGEEFVYVLKGVLHCMINDELYLLEKGDSLLFLAAQPHIYRNQSPSVAEILIIFQPGVGQMVAHRHHND